MDGSIAVFNSDISNRKEQSAKLEQGEITKEQYDQWRYNYPKFDTSNHWAKVPSQTINDIFTTELDNKSDK